VESLTGTRVMHVDEFVERHGGDAYARFFFMLARLPACCQVDFAPWTVQYKLFCDHEGKRYRVTGASRLGDVWLVADFQRDSGHDLRVDVDNCSNWSPKR
jgi:hypothetical protein